MQHIGTHTPTWDDAASFSRTRCVDRRPAADHTVYRTKGERKRGAEWQWHAHGSTQQSLRQGPPGTREGTGGRERAPSGCKKHGECTRNGGCGCRNMRGARARTQMHAASTQGRRQHTEGSKIADASVARWCCGRRKEKRMVRRGDRAEHEGEVGIPMEGESATAHARRKKPAPDGGSRRRRQQTRRQQNGTAPNPTHPTLSYAPHGSSFRPCVGLTTLTSPRSMYVCIGTCAGARPKR